MVIGGYVASPYEEKHFALGRQIAKIGFEPMALIIKTSEINQTTPLRIEGNPIKRPQMKTKLRFANQIM